MRFRIPTLMEYSLFVATALFLAFSDCSVAQELRPNPCAMQLLTIIIHPDGTEERDDQSSEEKKKKEEVERRRKEEEEYWRRREPRIDERREPEKRRETPPPGTLDRSRVPPRKKELPN